MTRGPVATSLLGLLLLEQPRRPRTRRRYRRRGPQRDAERRRVDRSPAAAVDPEGSRHPRGAGQRDQRAVGHLRGGLRRHAGQPGRSRHAGALGPEHRRAGQLSQLRRPGWSVAGEEGDHPQWLGRQAHGRQRRRPRSVDSPRAGRRARHLQRGERGRRLDASHVLPLRRRARQPGAAPGRRERLPAEAEEGRRGVLPRLQRRRAQRPRDRRRLRRRGVPRLSGR